MISFIDQLAAIWQELRPSVLSITVLTGSPQLWD